MTVPAMTVETKTAADAMAMTSTDRPDNPLELSASALFALSFVIVSLASTWVKTAIGAAGIDAGRRLPKEESVQRYKGLGEMNAKELWETTMDPDQRLMLQVTLDDAAHADEIFSILMGEDVEQRRSFIQRNAKDVRFLDI